MDNHIHNKSSCPNCNGTAPWNYDKLVSAAAKTYGNKYNYSLVPLDIKGIESHINIICNICNYQWSATINIGNASNCHRTARWTYQGFIQRAHKIHGDKYNYNQITPELFINSKVHLPITCVTCYLIWNPNLGAHINKKSSCPRWELLFIDYFKSRDLQFFPQTELPSLPDRYYDFSFIYEGIWYIIEFDGEQHFKFTPFFHREETKFQEKQQIDITKTLAAINAGYKVIRIDHTQINNIGTHIDEALRLKQSLYVSTPKLYSHIVSPVMTTLRPNYLTLNVTRS